MTGRFTQQELLWLASSTKDGITSIDDIKADEKGNLIEEEVTPLVSLAQRIAWADMKKEKVGGKVGFEIFPIEHMKTHDPVGGFTQAADGRFTVSTGWKSRPRRNGYEN